MRPVFYRLRVSGEAFDVVRAGYDALGSRYRAWAQDDSVRLRQLALVRDRLRPGSVVVELGCGGGEPVTRLLSQMHHVVAVDASAVQLAMARRAAPAATFVQADMTRLQLQPGVADAVVSFYALGHIPSGRVAQLMRSIASWLRPVGLLLTSAPAGVGDVVDPDWLGVPMFFGGTGEQGVRAAVRDAGLAVRRLERINEEEGNGKTASFVWLLADKPEAGSVGGTPQHSPEALRSQSSTTTSLEGLQAFSRQPPPASPSCPFPTP